MKSFVLKVGPLGERDLLVTAISRERGKERLRAPGVRRDAAKLKSHVQPLSWSAIHTAAGRIQRVIVDAERLGRLTTQSSNRLRALWFLADLIDGLTIEDEPTETFFSYLERATETVSADGTSHPVSVALFWGARLLEEAGYAMTASFCHHCKRSLKNPVFWSAKHKGLVCRTGGEDDAVARPLSKEAFKVLQFLQYGGEDHATRLRLNKELEQEVCLLLRDTARLLSGSLVV